MITSTVPISFSHRFIRTKRTWGMGARAEGADDSVGICSLNNTLSYWRSRVTLLLVWNLSSVSHSLRCGMRVLESYFIASGTNEHCSQEQNVHRVNVMITPSLVPKRLCTRTVRKRRFMFTSVGKWKFHREHNPWGDKSRMRYGGSVALGVLLVYSNRWVDYSASSSS